MQSLGDNGCALLLESRIVTISVDLLPTSDAVRVAFAALHQTLSTEDLRRILQNLHQGESYTPCAACLYLQISTLTKLNTGLLLRASNADRRL